MSNKFIFKLILQLQIICEERNLRIYFFYLSCVLCNPENYKLHKTIKTRNNLMIGNKWDVSKNVFTNFWQCIYIILNVYLFTLI